MKKTRAIQEGITQTSHGSTQSISAEALLPHSGNPKALDRSTSVSQELETPIMLNHEQIMKRARAIWIQHGRLEGQDKADWYAAEAQLRTIGLANRR
ncbi:DUF2934 domain-containing protein [Planctomycetota bacterium]